MATFLVGAAVAVIAGAAIWKMAADKKAGKSMCSCGGDCSRCKGCH